MMLETKQNNNTNTKNKMKYAKQETKPEWFQRGACMDICVTHGTSYSNEWYSFEDVSDAIETVSGFESQSFIDHMMVHEGVLYYLSDLTIDDNGDVVGICPNATINDFHAALQFESPF